MRSVIVSTTARFLLPLLLLFSLSLLLRGHDVPGGGFAGGLVAATAFALHLFAGDLRGGARLLRVDPQVVTGAGLLVAAASGAAPLAAGRPLLTGAWWTARLPALGEVEIGTPLSFDAGVYLVVAGVTLELLFALAER
ncbi:MAG: Na+/H+ antiporter subunit B [Polyangiaceae bacterium]|nr:Na+/H+ antiporter subunit B [Polyangiaceae bacterium]